MYNIYIYIYIYIYEYSHSFVFPSAKCVIVRQLVSLRLSFYTCISDRKNKYEINALMKKASYDSILYLIYKTTTKCKSLFFNMQLKSGRGRDFPCTTFRKCPCYNECVPEQIPFLLRQQCLPTIIFLHRSVASFEFRFILKLYLQNHFHFYDLIASRYTKGKWQWRQGYLFCLQSYHFDKKMFLYICLFLSI